MYYIYHIKGVKIGVSQDPKSRVADQGFSDYEILEEHTDIYEVSDREQHLQKEYGYPVDASPYWNSRSHWGSKAGKKGGSTNIPMRRKLMSNVGKSNRHLTFEEAEYIRAQKKRGVDVFGNPITNMRLAKAFNTSNKVIWKILHNVSYTTP